MNKTKNDLSFDLTKLDYQALLQTAEVAFAELRHEIFQQLEQLQHYPLPSCFYLNAHYIEGYSNQLVVVAETLHTLREGLTRHNLEVVNKPEIKEEDDKNE